MNMQVTVIERQATNVIYARGEGDYANATGQAWGQLMPFLYGNLAVAMNYEMHLVLRCTAIVIHGVLNQKAYIQKSIYLCKSSLFVGYCAVMALSQLGRFFKRAR